VVLLEAMMATYKKGIEGFEEEMRIPLRGKIRLGGPKNDKGYAGHELSHLGRVTDCTDLDLKRFRELFGDEPVELPITFSTDDVHTAMGYEYVRYAKGVMACHGNGVIARERIHFLKPEAESKLKECQQRRDKKGADAIAVASANYTFEETEIRCPAAECKWQVQKKCKPQLVIQCQIRGMNGILPWWIVTTSKTCMKTLPAVFEHIRTLNGGTIIGVPLVLRRIKRAFVLPNGMKTEKFVLHLDLACELADMISAPRIPKAEREAAEVLFGDDLAGEEEDPQTDPPDDPPVVGGGETGEEQFWAAAGEVLPGSGVTRGEVRQWAQDRSGCLLEEISDDEWAALAALLAEGGAAVVGGAA